MATPEPPPKKRKLLEAKSTNKSELRSLFESYKKIRFCLDSNDPRLMPDLEKAYLSLISASQGCSSVQRIVAELIPRYVSYFPTALEAATKASINMYKWSLHLMSKGEDIDRSAFYTAKACIIGLAEICHTASLDASSSSSYVFNKVLTFLVSSFEGKDDIYRIGRDQIEKLQDPMEFLYELKVENEDDAYERDNDIKKLFEIRVLILFCMFFSSPKNMMNACFGEGNNLSDAGIYFINQVCHDFKSDINEVDRENNDAGKNLGNCFLEMVIKRDISFKSWIISKHKSLSESHNSNSILKISSLIWRVLSSFPETIDEKENQDIPMDITEESPKNTPETFTPENNNKNRIENISTNTLQKNKFENISTNTPQKNKFENISTNTPQNTIFDFNTNAVSSFIISASKELWISYLNTNASEPSLKSKFEEFGPIDKLLFYPPKKFAIIEYKNIHDALKAHFFMQGSSFFGGFIKVKYLDKGLGSKGFLEGVAIGDSCFLHVGNVLSQQEREDILGELSCNGSRILPVSVKDLKSENAILIEFRSPEEAAVAKARIRLRNDKFAPGARGLSGSVQSPIDRAGSCTPAPHVSRPNWPIDPSYPGPSPSSIERQGPHTWPHRNSIVDPKLAIRPPIFAPPVSPSFSCRPPPTNQISPRAIPTGNFRTPLPFIPSSVTPLSQIQIPGASLQNPPGTSLQKTPGGSVQNSSRVVLPPPPVVVPPFVVPVQTSVESGNNNNNKWRGVLSKSGVNYCTIYAVREETDACSYTNGASEPKDWPSKLDVTKRTDMKNVKITFNNIPASKREVCRLLPASSSDQKGFGDFITYLKQRECAGVIKIPGVKPMWSRLLFILPHSTDNCTMLGINPSFSDCLIGLVLPKDTHSE